MRANRARLAEWPLHRRLAVTLAACGVVLLGLVLVSAGTLVGVRQQQSRVAVGYYGAVEQSRLTFVQLVDVETAVRGYALTRDARTLEPMRAATLPWSPEALSLSRDLLGPDAPAVRAAEAAQAQARRWRDEWVVPTLARIDAGERLDAEDVLDGKRRFDAVRRSYDAYLGELTTARTDALTDLRRRTDLLFLAVVVSALASGGTALAVWTLLRRWVTRPIGDLAAETRVIGGGDLDHVVAVDGPPEILVLAADVEAMRARLVEQIAQTSSARDEAEAARTELERQAQDLQRSNRDLEQFAYVASHDLQEPLRKVTSFCQLLQRRYGGQLDDRADQYIGFAVDGARRMQQLINDLLSFSRVGRLVEATTDVDLGALARGVVEDLSRTIEEAGATVVVGDLPTVQGQAGLLRQLLANLVGNAVKFRGSDPPVVELGARLLDGEWELWCRDNGIGIGPEYVDKVFVIFQRLHGRDAYEGTGIGLALCKKIVEFHGGRIWIGVSEPGTAPQGTTVRWTLPSTPAGAAGDPHGDGDRPAEEPARV
ncbi:MAG: ATP-binding protein [Kineosporiaceae bacterium]